MPPDGRVNSRYEPFSCALVTSHLGVLHLDVCWTGGQHLPQSTGAAGRPTYPGHLRVDTPPPVRSLRHIARRQILKCNHVMSAHT